MAKASPNHQNPSRGRDFATIVRLVFEREGLVLEPEYTVNVGASDEKRPRKFDLGSEDPPVLVECKRHTWTEGSNAPSAKMSVWNEAMYYFFLAPRSHRRILAVARDVQGGKSLAEYYLSRFRHLVPVGVEIWEIDVATAVGRCVHPCPVQ